ncbi:MAG: hypothetical protein AAB327_01910 [Actinomycetota bacterium]
MATPTQTPRTRSAIVPDGIVANCANIRRRGGFVAVAIATTMSLIGAFLIFLPGTMTGVVGFLLINAGIPVLAITGIPAVSGTGRFVVAITASIGVWWTIGHFAAMRASRRTIVGWTEWRREFQPLAIGVWVGTVLALAVTAFVLGAL